MAVVTISPNANLLGVSDFVSSADAIAFTIEPTTSATILLLVES